MPVAPKDAVYQTGPDDSLRVVDVYGNGTVAEAFDLLSSTQYIKPEGSDSLRIDPTLLPTSEETAAAVQSLRSELASGNSDISNEDLLSLNLGKEQTERFIAERVPDSTDKTQLIQDNAAMGVNELNETLKVLSKQEGGDYASMSQPDLQKAVVAHSNAVTGLERKALGDGTELEQIGVTEADTRLETLQKLNTAGQSCSANQTIKSVSQASRVDTRYNTRAQQVNTEINEKGGNAMSPRNRRHVEREVVKNAAQDGNHRLVKDLMEISEQGFDPWFRRQNVLNILENYGFETGVTNAQKKDLGRVMKSNINQIDPTLMSLEGLGTPRYLLDIYGTVSEDGAEALSFDEHLDIALTVMNGGVVKGRNREQRVNNTLDGLMA